MFLAPVDFLEVVAAVGLTELCVPPNDDSDEVVVLLVPLVALCENKLVLVEFTTKTPSVFRLTTWPLIVSAPPPAVSVLPPTTASSMGLPSVPVMYVGVAVSVRDGLTVMRALDKAVGS